MNLFVSTRGASEAASAPQAVLRGIAPDGGLYIREKMPRIAPEELAGAGFCEIAERVLGDYLTGYSREEIARCVSRAYDGKFASAQVAPLKQVGDKYVLELFHGPTAAFKDVALSVLPQLMSCALEKTGAREEILILTATSGDTGSAALRGFADVEGIRIIVFYPNEGISPIQRAQMTTMAGSNLDVCAISGNFDDAQTGVKRIFTGISPDFCREHGVALSSANSINIGRLAPQIVYYYSAYLALVERGALRMGERANFCVPTGNFGDILAGLYAREMGLPVGKLICASNENCVLTDFFRSGVYDRRRAFVTTLSPSMDILVSSNLERMLYLALEGDAQAVAERMRALSAQGFYRMPDAAMARIREVFDGECATDAQALDAIARVFRAHGYLMDPHTAVAWRAAEDYGARSGDAAPCVVLSTASPYKFPQSALRALGESAPQGAVAQLERLEALSGTRAPAALSEAIARRPRFDAVIAPDEMMEYVLRKAARR